MLSFSEKDDEFRIYIDAQTRLPAQTEILEDDPLEGDSSYTLRYGDWRKVDGVMLPFSLRYELNGKVLQEEQIRSIRHNLALGGDVFAIPAVAANNYFMRLIKATLANTDALSHMPDNQRRAILLREWQGLSYHEIASELKLSQSAVETLIFRARRTLRRECGVGDAGDHHIEPHPHREARHQPQPHDEHDLAANHALEQAVRSDPQHRVDDCREDVRTVRFHWDCKWKAQQEGWSDYFGFPDQMRAARETARPT